MGLFARLREERATKAIGGHPSGGSWIDGWFGGSCDVNEQTAMQLATVWACVRAISEDVSKLPLKVYRWKSDDEREKVRGHPVSKLLNRRANSYATPSMIVRETLLARALLWGNGYAEIERDNTGRPIGLWPLDNVKVTPTVENGQLWLLQTRDGKRTPQAQARIALDLCDEGVIDAAEARRRTAGLDPATLSVERVVGGDGSAPLAEAMSAAHGVAVGQVALDEAAARRLAAQGRPVLLVRQDAETSDIAALEQSVGLLTERGARTSHAAVVARQLGKVCLVGCTALRIDPARRQLHFHTPAGEVAVDEGAQLTLDGHRGWVLMGAARTEREAPAELLARLAVLRARTG